MKQLDTLLWGLLVVAVVSLLVFFFESDKEIEPPALTKINEELTVNAWSDD